MWMQWWIFVSVMINRLRWTSCFTMIIDDQEYKSKSFKIKILELWIGFGGGREGRFWRKKVTTICNEKVLVYWIKIRISIFICWFQNYSACWAFTDSKYSIFHLILYIYFRWMSAESRRGLVQCPRGLQGQTVTRKMEFSYTTCKN